MSCLVSRFGPGRYYHCYYYFILPSTVIFEYCTTTSNTPFSITMPSTGTVLSLATALSVAKAASQGFNYGATFTDSTIKQESDFEAEFKAAAELPGTDGAFTSGRLFTMIVSLILSPCMLRRIGRIMMYPVFCSNSVTYARLPGNSKAIPTMIPSRPSQPPSRRAPASSSVSGHPLVTQPLATRLRLSRRLSTSTAATSTTSS